MSRRSEAGHSLIEAVIVAGAVGMVAAIVAPLFLQAGRLIAQLTARADVAREARVNLSIIERELAQARGRTIILDRLNADQPHYSRLSFSLRDGRTVRVYQRGTRLYRQVVAPGGSRTTLVATGLRQAVFSYPMSDNPGLVSISLTFERATYGGQSKTLQLSLSRVRIQNADAY